MTRSCDQIPRRIFLKQTSAATLLAGLGLTAAAGAVIAPTLEEAPIHVECSIFNTINVPSVRTLFLADVIATTVQQGVCDEDGWRIVEAVLFFGMTAGSGEFYSMGEAVGHIGKSVGRSDIKY